ncbi:protein of unknown function, partial [Allopseudospirillum japonicum]
GFYQGMLGRQADLEGFQWWAQKLDAGADLAQVAVDILALSLVEQTPDQSTWIQGLYQGILGREAHAQKVDAWQSSETLTVLAEQLLASAEYQSTQGTQMAVQAWDFWV